MPRYAAARPEKNVSHASNFKAPHHVEPCSINTPSQLALSISVEAWPTSPYYIGRLVGYTPALLADQKVRFSPVSNSPLRCYADS